MWEFCIADMTEWVNASGIPPDYLWERVLFQTQLAKVCFVRPFQIIQSR